MPSSKICIIISSCLLMSLVLIGVSWQLRASATISLIPDRPAANHRVMNVEQRSAPLPADFPTSPSHRLPNKSAIVQKKQSTHAYVEKGKATWYADRFHGRHTASGEVYSKHKLTAAHPKLPFGSQVRVTHLRNKRSVVVTINDRGTFRRGRIIDLSRRAAEELQMVVEGVAKVKVELLEMEDS